ATSSLRGDVVEDAVITEAELVHSKRRKDVCLADGYVAGVVDDALVAAECALFGESGRAAWNVRVRLVIAEAGEYGIRSREIVIDANIELRLIEFSDRRINEVNTGAWVVCIRRRVKIHHGLSDRIDQTIGTRRIVARHCAGDLGTRCASCLRAIGVDR